MNVNQHHIRELISHFFPSVVLYPFLLNLPPQICSQRINQRKREVKIYFQGTVILKALVLRRAHCRHEHVVHLSNHLQDINLDKWSGKYGCQMETLW